MGSALDPVYRAIEMFDGDRLGRALRPDVFLLTPTAGGVLIGSAVVLADLQTGFDAMARRGRRLRLDVGSASGGSTDGRVGHWVFDEVVAEVVEGGTTFITVPLRVTALVTHDERDDGWRLAAGYWSIPYESQARQDAVKRAGLLEPGATLAPAVAGDARHLADRLAAALEQPRLLPQLYSTRDDHVTIGSVVDEVFRGRAGRAAWQEFVEHVTTFTLRGPMRAQLVTPDLGWTAANIDIGDPPTPYRFFHIWLRDEGDWRIVVSHDAVSREAWTQCFGPGGQPG